MDLGFLIRQNRNNSLNNNRQNNNRQSSYRDKFANLMSHREKRFVVEIQMKQLRTTDPLNDDYYYAKVVIVSSDFFSKISFNMAFCHFTLVYCKFSIIYFLKLSVTFSKTLSTYHSRLIFHTSSPLKTPQTPRTKQSLLTRDVSKSRKRGFQLNEFLYRLAKSVWNLPIKF